MRHATSEISNFSERVRLMQTFQTRSDAFRHAFRRFQTLQTLPTFRALENI